MSLKIKEKDSATVRILKQLGQGAIIGAIVGLVLAVCLVMTEGKLSFVNESLFFEVIIWGLRILGVLATVISIEMGFQTKKLVDIYENTEDDDASEDLYRNLNLKHNYATIYNGFAVLFAMITIVLAYKFKIDANGAIMMLPVTDFASLILSLLIQMRLLKLYNRIRGIEMTTVPTLKELKNNVMRMDEAEIQANYKMAYDVVLNLSGIILPSIYMVLLFISIFFQRVEISGILVAAVIHGYIIFANFKMARDFYK